MNILLVNPPCLDTRISDEDAGILPMGLHYIGALLREKKFGVTILNLAGRDDPLAVLEEVLVRLKPGIMGVSVLNPNRFGAMEAAALAKKLLPGITTVFGGAAATFLAEHLLGVCRDLDIIVKGEGEETFLELAGHFASKRPVSLEEIQGLVFRRDGELVHTETRPLIKDLDFLPQPGKYFSFEHLSLSRGCPGKCTFCGSPEFWGRSKVRFHSPEWFVSNLALLVRQGITHFYFSDDTFTMDKKRVVLVCRKILDQQLDITWAAISRVDFLDEEMLLWMRRAGCIQISFGVESGSRKIRKILGKPVKQERIIKAFEMTVSYGILPRAYFIYGSPGETPETIQESLDLMAKIRPLAAVFYLLVVFPGTGLYRDLEESGIVSDQIWKEKMEDIPWFQMDPHLDFQQVKAFGDKLRHGFYSQVDSFARKVKLVDLPELCPLHADFLSRLAMTFSHGEYADDSRVRDARATAKALYTRALEYHPHSRAFLGLAMLHQKKMEFGRAVAVLEKGLEANPRERTLLLCMGISLMNLGRFRRALSVLESLGGAPDVLPYVNACRAGLSKKG